MQISGSNCGWISGDERSVRTSSQHMCNVLQMDMCIGFFLCNIYVFRWVAQSIVALSEDTVFTL